ncbi:hypothetical protein [Paraburkholderia ribeironis]|uniref:hypothetical protein n=1 Tax=Paraburkholderia ribeironis TaxID=1247936 RepID=UPI000B9D5170|nr:hypothetical protein [Paraburkholderia ribeironis]
MKYGQPEIVNTDQGSQFTSDALTGAVPGKGIQLSLVGLEQSAKAYAVRLRGRNGIVGFAETWHIDA